MKTTGHSARIGPMGYALFLPVLFIPVLFLAAALLMAGLSGAASARTQFIPPGGLPLTTQIGTATNSDGTPAVTLGSMQEGMAANGRHIAALQNAILSHDALAAELAPYQTRAEAEARYATQEAVAGAISGAVQAETDRAGSAERRNAEDIAAIRSGYVPTGTLNTVLRSYVTGTGLGTALAPYQTRDEAEARYATQEAVAGAISGAVQAETDRAGSAEQRNAEDIAAIRSGYVPTGTLDTVLRSYVTGTGLGTALAPYQTRDEAEARYATQEAVAGAISGAVQAETDRAGSAERRNAEDIAAIRSGYVPTGTLNTVLRSYVTGSGLDVALAPYLTQDEAEAAYLSRSGGRTSGPLNGVDFLDGLVGSSAPGSAVVLTTDNSGAMNGANCMRVPPVGITGLTIVAAGVSSNGTDAVMQKFDGVAVFTAHGTPLMANQGASSNYPSFGSPGAWSVTASVDVPTRCVVITVRAGGSGSWKWRASMRAETLLP